MLTRSLRNGFACLAALAAPGFLALGFASASQAASIAVVAAFGGFTGYAPYGPVTIDSQGNLFGTTYSGGSAGDGVVWEIPHGTTTITDVSSFAGGAGGANPYGGVAVDGSGNIFGVAFSGGDANNDGTVFEIVHGTNTITTLAEFAGGAGGSGPYGGVILDSSGNLYGTTQNGGSASGAGTIWEIAHGSATITTLAQFNGTNGANPSFALTMDGSGNLYGVTAYGGVDHDGNVFELPHGSGTIINIASADETNSSGTSNVYAPTGSVALDANGDLFGTAQGDPGSSLSTVWEVAHGSGVFTALAAFNGTGNQFPDGQFPNGATIDGAGNLFGTTLGGGAGNNGTVWELPHGASALTLIDSFVYSNGAAPHAGVTVDSSGNLFGTATGGSTNDAGVVFEVAGVATPFGSTATHAQLLWNNVNGEAALWNINPDGSYTSNAYGPYSGWTAKAVSEAPDGADWLLWTNTSGEVSLWRVSASGYTTVQYGPYPGYQAVSLSIGSDGNPRLLWNETNGVASLWDINKSTGGFTHAEYGPYTGYTANKVASGTTVTDLLWNKTDGTAAGWRINNASGALTTSAFGPFSGYSCVSLSVGPDDGAHLLWDSTSGSEALWSADFTSGAYTATSYGPISGWATKSIATGPDYSAWMLWDNTSGEASLWDIIGSNYTHTEYGPFSGWTAVGVSAGP